MLNQLYLLLLIEGGHVQFGDVVTLASLFECAHPHVMNLVQDQALVLHANPVEKLVEAGTLAWHGAPLRQLRIVARGRLRMLRVVVSRVQLVHAAALGESIEAVLDVKGSRRAASVETAFASVWALEVLRAGSGLRDVVRSTAIRPDRRQYGTRSLRESVGSGQNTETVHACIILQPTLGA